MEAKKDLTRLLAIEDTETNSHKIWESWKSHPKRNAPEFIGRLQGRRLNYIILYTDGASNNQDAGYGFAAFESNRLCHSEKGLLGRICPSVFF